MTNLLLSQNKISRGIFNSLLEITAIDLRGSKPEPPSVISAEDDCQSRCVNFENCWQEPSDLRYRKTWRAFATNVETHQLDINLIVLDMQHQGDSGDLEIIGNLQWFLRHDRVSGRVTCIYKMFLSVLETESFCLGWFTRYFKKVLITQTEASGFKTSEVYVVATRYHSDGTEDYPLNRDMFLKVIKPFYCFRSDEEEFNRMVGLLRKDTILGIPERLIGDQESFLSLALEGLGISTRVSSLLAKNWVSRPDEYIFRALPGICYLGVTEILGMDIQHYNQSTPIPSDGTVTRLAVFCLSLMYWRALATNDFYSFLSCEEVLNTGFPFYWLEKETHGGSHYKWSMTQGQTNKWFRLDDKKIHLGNLGRRFLTIKKASPGGPYSEALSEMFIIKGLPTYKFGHIKTRTPIFMLLSGRRVCQHVVPRYSVDKGTFSMGGLRKSEAWGRCQDSRKKIYIVILFWLFNTPKLLLVTTKVLG